MARLLLSNKNFLLRRQNSWNLNDTTLIFNSNAIINPHNRLPINLFNTTSLLHSRCVPDLRSSFSSMATPHSSAQDPPQSQSSSTKTVRVVIKGRVQGVFYRNWTIENAIELDLKGWVRNKRDGSVEALFSGCADSVQEMEQRCRRGPPASIVTCLDVFISNEDPGTGFERKPTA
jgi:acylphosphatase